MSFHPTIQNVFFSSSFCFKLSQKSEYFFAEILLLRNTTLDHGDDACGILDILKWSTTLHLEHDSAVSYSLKSQTQRCHTYTEEWEFCAHFWIFMWPLRPIFTTISYTYRGFLRTICLKAECIYAVRLFYVFAVL